MPLIFLEEVSQNSECVYVIILPFFVIFSYYLEISQMQNLLDSSESFPLIILHLLNWDSHGVGYTQVNKDFYLQCSALGSIFSVLVVFVAQVSEMWFRQKCAVVYSFLALNYLCIEVNFDSSSSFFFFFLPYIKCPQSFRSL